MISTKAWRPVEFRPSARTSSSVQRTGNEQGRFLGTIERTTVLHEHRTGETGCDSVYEEPGGNHHLVKRLFRAVGGKDKIQGRLKPQLICPLHRERR